MLGTGEPNQPYKAESFVLNDRLGAGTLRVL
jgi:hypothetical protein